MLKDEIGEKINLKKLPKWKKNNNQKNEDQICYKKT
jgi:hypothetical protein